MLAVTQDRAEQDQRLSTVFEDERRRLLAFIRRRLPNEIDAEDLLQDVFYELVEAYRLMTPIAHAGAWMMQVARNRITDLFRRKKPVVEDSKERILRDLLPSPDAGPDALFARGVLLAEIEAALGELPPNQREVFIAHEIEGRSFAEISVETGDYSVPQRPKPNWLAQGEGFSHASGLWAHSAIRLAPALCDRRYFAMVRSSLLASFPSGFTAWTW